VPRCLVFLALTLASLAACGGRIDESVPGGADSGATLGDPPLTGAQQSSAGLPDDATDAGHDGFFACVLTPVAGVSCTSTASLCAPPAACGDPSWQCVEGQWQYMQDTGCTGADAAVFDGAGVEGALPGCEACASGVCVVTHTGTATTRHCERTPLACTGVGPSCDCAGSYCGEGCACVGATSSGEVECACPAP
jgi:hypothetical protein